MSRAKTISVVCLLILTTLGFASFVRPQTGAGASAKAAQAENDLTMQALLNEVRQLRLAIQRSNLSAYKSQITIERIRSQQQSVDRLADRLRDARNQLAGIKMPQADFQSELKRIEARLNQEGDVEKRKILEEEQERFKNRLAMLAQEEARIRENESQLAAQLQIEQGRLTDLNDQLDVLQRELELPPAENNPSQNGKRP
jgi:hypothetical protein